MRLSKDEIENLKSSIHYILPGCQIYLFGSRVDDAKKGGDIDILILGQRKLDFIEKAQIEKSFFIHFGEQKLDLVSFEENETSSFKELVLNEAVEL